jgi:hypothetical protein
MTVMHYSPVSVTVWRRHELYSYQFPVLQEKEDDGKDFPVILLGVRYLGHHPSPSDQVCFHLLSRLLLKQHDRFE